MNGLGPRLKCHRSLAIDWMSSVTDSGWLISEALSSILIPVLLIMEKVINLMPAVTGLTSRITGARVSVVCRRSLVPYWSCLVLEPDSKCELCGLRWIIYNRRKAPEFLRYPKLSFSKFLVKFPVNVLSLDSKLFKYSFPDRRHSQIFS